MYKKYVLYKGKQTIIYIRMLKSLYRMHFYSIFYYKQFRKDVEAIGFEVNPYNTCVAHRMKYYIQKTVTRHVDDLKSSHVDPKVNN